MSSLGDAITRALVARQQGKRLSTDSKSTELDDEEERKRKEALDLKKKATASNEE